jgi:hypothetical protein
MYICEGRAEACTRQEINVESCYLSVMLDKGPLGVLMLELSTAEMSRRWVRSRTEKVAIADPRSITREIELRIDLRNAMDRVERVGAEDELIPVPIQIVRGDWHGPVRFEDSHGNVVPTCDETTERAIVRAGLLALVEEIFARESVSCPGEGELEALIAEGLIAEGRIAASWQRRRTVEHAIDRVLGLSETSATNEWFAGAIHAVLSPLTKDGKVEVLTLIARWANKRLQLALVDPQVLSGEFVVRFRLTERVSRPRVGVRTTLARLRRILFGALSWSFVCSIGSAYRAAITYIDVEAPPGFNLVEPALYFEHRSDPNRGTWMRAESGGERAEFVFRPDQDAIEEPVHLVVSAYAGRAGLLAQSASASILVLMVLTAFTIRLVTVRFDVHRFNSEFAAGVLLFVPAVLIQAAAYREGSRLESGVASYFRLALMLEIIAVLGAALPFAFELTPHSAETTWFVAATIGLAGCVRVLLGSTLHTWQTSVISARLRALRRRLEASTVASKRNRESGLL